MNVSGLTITSLGNFITGDEGIVPYLSGRQLVDFFNQCGFNDTYGEGFPTRVQYCRDKIKEANNSTLLIKIIEEFVDPRRYGNDNLVGEIVNKINSLIIYDDYQLIKKDKFYKVQNTKSPIIESKSIKNINHDFINEQIDKCKEKINNQDYNGAITNARTLVEAVFIHIIETIEDREISNDGKIDSLWKQTKKALKLDFNKADFPEYIYQTITGLETSLNGLAAISNNTSDRHANKFLTKQHHAKLAVNIAFTITDFLIDILNQKHIVNNKS